MKKLIFLFFVSLFTFSFGQTKDSTIPFAIAKQYFVRNDYPDKDLHLIKIVDEEQFNHIFGKAPLMGKKGKSTPINFETSFVLALIDSTNEMTEELVVKSLTKEGANIYLHYDLKQREKASSAQFRFCTLIVVDNKYKGTVVGRRYNPTGEPIVGDDLDEIGCKPSTGMSWSILKNDCIYTWETSYVVEGINSNFALLFNQDNTKAEIIGLHTLNAKYKGNLIFDQTAKEEWKNRDLILIEVAKDQFILKEGNKEIAYAKLR